MHAVLEGVIERIACDLNGLAVEAAQLCPNGNAQGRSIQQAVENLVQGYRITAESLEFRLKQGRVTRNQGRSGLQFVLQIMILSFGYVPKGVELPNETQGKPIRLAPMNGSELVRLLREELGVMDALLDKCRTKFGMERIAVHPLLGPLRVDQWRRLHAVYTLHCFKEMRFLRQRITGLEPNVKLAKEMHIPAQRPLT